MATTSPLPFAVFGVPFLFAGFAFGGVAPEPAVVRTSQAMPHRKATATLMWPDLARDPLNSDGAVFLKCRA
jgi:hypothetical protein